MAVTPWINANGERIEKVEAREAAASADLRRRGVVIAECPHCRAILEVPTDGRAVRCEGNDDPYWGEAGCGAEVTIADVQD